MEKPLTRLVVRRLLKADRERVFSALGSPAKMAEWFFGMENGQAKVVCDFRVGGQYRIEMSDREKKCVPSGQYLEIVPPEKLVFTWSVEGIVRNSKVTIELFKKGDWTELVLTHELPPEVLEGHQDGWKHCFDHLESLLARQGDS
jgi:uncharacterized protein YndB with AHSA1/START domain